MDLFVWFVEILQHVENISKNKVNYYFKMRIAGVNVPAEKRVVISLQYIYGVGPIRAKHICKQTNVEESIRVKDLSADQEEMLRAAVAEFTVEADLRRELSQNVKHLQDIGTYRGFRHRKRLPVRGQRTKTNSRTKRGKKVTVANKKKVTK